VLPPLDRLRFLAPVVAFAFAVCQLANALHFAACAHVFCAEHQRLEHVAQHRSEARNPASAPCHHDHERCEQATTARAFPTITWAAPQACRPLSTCDVVAASPARIAIRGLPVFFVAPKNSPPA
jgi:hypothetical protein